MTVARASSRALQRAEQNADAHLRRGEAFEREGDGKRAHQEFRAAYVADPFSDLCLLTRELVQVRLQAQTEQSREPERAVALTASRTGGITILVGPDGTQVGEGTTFSVRLATSPRMPLAACSLALAFDPAMLRVVDFEQGSGILALSAAETTPGRLLLRFTAKPGFDGAAGRATFAAAKAGTTAISIQDATAADSSGNALVVPSHPARIIVGQDADAHPSSPAPPPANGAPHSDIKS